MQDRCKSLVDQGPNSDEFWKFLSNPFWIIRLGTRIRRLTLFFLVFLLCLPIQYLLWPSSGLASSCAGPSKRPELAFEQSVNNYCLSDWYCKSTWNYILSIFPDYLQLLLWFILLEQKLYQTSVHIWWAYRLAFHLGRRWCLQHPLATGWKCECTHCKCIIGRDGESRYNQGVKCIGTYFVLNVSEETEELKKTLPKEQRPQGIEYFDLFNTFILKQKLQ